MAAIQWFVLLLSVSNVISWIQSRERCDYNVKPSFGNNYSNLEHAKVGDEYHIDFCDSIINFCNIKWYKDGREMDMSDDHFVPLDYHHKRVNVKSVRLSDNATFVCVASNNMGSVNRSVHISVSGKTCTKADIESSKTQSNMLIGSQYNETFTVTIPWETPNCAFWYTSNTNEDNSSNSIDRCPDLVKDLHLCSICATNSSNKNQVLATLRFQDIREDDLHFKYTLYISDGSGLCSIVTQKEFNLPTITRQKLEVQYRPVMSLVCGIVLITLLCVFTWQHIKVPLQLVTKDYLGKSEACDGRWYDAYISYTWSQIDRLFVLQLKSQLENRGYRVYLPEIDNIPGGCTAAQLVEALEQSRRFIMVLSPEYVKANFTTFEINIFLETVNKYKDYIIPVVFKGLTLSDDCVICRHIMKVTQTVMWANIEWPISDQYKNILDGTNNVTNCYQNSKVSMEKSFKMRGYKELLLKLPPKPMKQNNDYSLLVESC